MTARRLQAEKRLLKNLLKFNEEPNAMEGSLPWWIDGNSGGMGHLPTQQEDKVLIRNKLYDPVEERLFIPRNTDEVLDAAGYEM